MSMSGLQMIANELKYELLQACAVESVNAEVDAKEERKAPELLNAILSLQPPPPQEGKGKEKKKKKEKEKEKTG